MKDLVSKGILINNTQYLGKYSFPLLIMKIELIYISFFSSKSCLFLSLFWYLLIFIESCLIVVYIFYILFLNVIVCIVILVI